MRYRSCLLIAVSLALVNESRGHFLFVHVRPPAEGGRVAEVYFSELADAGDPRFIAKVAHTRLWVQTTPGQFQPLKVHQGPDRLRAPVPLSGSMAVVGACPYGVIARPKVAPFLLKHYPKAIAGNPDELNRMKPFDQVPLEILAAVEKDRITFTATRNGKPVPKAELITVDSSLKNEKLIADGEGRVSWKPPAPGRYSVYIRWLTKEPGDFEGKKYDEVREFATLAFDWPLERTGADAEAVALFDDAIAARAQWKDFPGFTADVKGTMDGRPFEGSIWIDAKGKVGMYMEEEVVQPWLTDQLESIVLHRRAEPDSGSNRPKATLRFAETKDDHPLGRLLLVEGGRFASSYRVKDRQITVVNRHMGPTYMTITILENEKNKEGRYLPHSYTAQFWDAAGGALKRTETVQDRWARVGSWDLPAQRTVTIASEAGLMLRTFTLSNHQLSAGK